MGQKQIIIGSDHAGFQCKSEIVRYLRENNFKIDDQGTHSEDPVDYPEIAHCVAKAVDSMKFSYGILICGSGIGVSIVANKYPNVRAALCWQETIAELSRRHNDANIICLPGRFIDSETATGCVRSFLNTEFEGGRHLARLNKINAIKP